MGKSWQRRRLTWGGSGPWLMCLALVLATALAAIVTVPAFAEGEPSANDDSSQVEEDVVTDPTQNGDAGEGTTGEGASADAGPQVPSGGTGGTADDAPTGDAPAATDPQVPSTDPTPTPQNPTDTPSPADENPTSGSVPTPAEPVNPGDATGEEPVYDPTGTPVAGSTDGGPSGDAVDPTNAIPPADPVENTPEAEPATVNAPVEDPSNSDAAPAAPMSVAPTPAELTPVAPAPAAPAPAETAPAPAQPKAAQPASSAADAASVTTKAQTGAAAPTPSTSVEAKAAAAVAAVAARSAKESHTLVPTMPTKASSTSLRTEAATPKTFVVRFYDAFGNVIRKVRVKSGSKASAPASASMAAAGRTFKGWDVAFTKVTKNLFVHPLYTDKNKTYIYSWSWSGKADDVITWFRRKAGSKMKLSNLYATMDGRPNQEGMEFIGWNTKPDGSGTFYDQDATFKAPSHDASLFACFRKLANGTVTLTLNSNGGDDYPSTQTIEKGTVVRLAQYASYGSITNQGYAMVGYNTKADGTGTTYTINDTLKLSKSTTLYAVWRKATAPLVVNDNYEGGTTSVTYLTGGRVYSLSTATRGAMQYREGYTFMGYNTRKDGKGTSYSFYTDAQRTEYAYPTIKLPSKGLTLYAQWKKNTNRTVTIKANYTKGASIERSSQFGRDLILPGSGDMQRAGYQLVGYNTKANGTGTSYGPREQITPTKAMTLYAQWKKVNAKVVLVPNYTGTNTFTGKKAVKTTVKTTKGHDAQLPHAGQTFGRSGYYLAGWNTKADGTGVSYRAGATLSAPSGKTLYAQWEKLYKLVVKPNYSSAPADGTSTSYYSAGNVVYLYQTYDHPNGYSFAGYNTKADGSGNTYAPGPTLTMPKRNLTLYARWKKNSATVKFVDYDGKGSTKTAKVAPGVCLNHQSEASYYLYEGKSGYEFAGWSTKKDGTGKVYHYVDFDTLKASSKGLTLYATWVKTPTITYVANNGTADKTIYHSFYASLDSKGYTKSGKAAYAWSTQADGKGTSYVLGSQISNLPKSIKLYEQWKTPTAKITYKWRDDSGKLITKTVGVIGGAYNGYALTLPKDRAKVYLDHWQNPADKTGNQYSSTSTNTFIPKKGLTLVAVWAKKSTVTYKANYSGSTDANITKYARPYSYVNVLKSDAFKRDEYYIASWNTKANGTGDSYNTHLSYVNSAYVGDSNLVLYAQWKRKITLAVNYNGGTAATTVVKRSIPTFDDYELSLSAYSAKAQREGYTLVGWADSKELADAGIVNHTTDGTYLWNRSYETYDHTLYAVWEKSEA